MLQWSFVHSQEVTIFEPINLSGNVRLTTIGLKVPSELVIHYPVKSNESHPYLNIGDPLNSYILAEVFKMVQNRWIFVTSFNDIRKLEFSRCKVIHPNKIKLPMTHCIYLYVTVVSLSILFFNFIFNQKSVNLLGQSSTMYHYLTFIQNTFQRSTTATT